MQKPQTGAKPHWIEKDTFEPSFVVSRWQKIKSFTLKLVNIKYLLYILQLQHVREDKYCFLMSNFNEFSFKALNVWSKYTNTD